MVDGDGLYDVIYLDYEISFCCLKAAASEVASMMRLHIDRYFFLAR